MALQERQAVARDAVATRGAGTSQSANGEDQQKEAAKDRRPREQRGAQTAQPRQKGGRSCDARRGENLLTHAAPERRHYTIALDDACRACCSAPRPSPGAT